MANLCSFVMRLVGNKEDIIAFHKAMSQEGSIWMGRGAVADLDFEEKNEEGYSAYITGWCKWSIKEAMIFNAISMRDNTERWGFTKDEISSIDFITLWEACQKWHLDMEVYSEECGCCFQEHMVFSDGDIQENECVDWYDFSDEDIGYIEKEIGRKLSKEEKKLYEEGERLEIGGFEWEFNWCKATRKENKVSDELRSVKKTKAKDFDEEL